MSQYERGFTPGSPTVHAARRTLQGLRALCDGRKVEGLSGRFDTAATEACPECLAAMNAR